MPRPADELSAESRRFPRRIAAAGGRVARRLVVLGCPVGLVAALVVPLAGGGAVASPAVAWAAVPAAPALPGAVARIVLQPARVSTVVHQSVTYAALGFEVSGLPLGDIHATARFSISPDGSCMQNRCRAERPGVHRVVVETGRAGQVVRSTAVLDVRALPKPPVPPSGAVPGKGSDPTNGRAPSRTPKPSTSAKTGGPGAGAPNGQRLQHSGRQATQSEPTPTPLPRLVITPGRKFVAPGERTAYVVVAFDGSGRPLGVVTSRAKLSITFSADGRPSARPEGSCSANACVAAKVGRHTVCAVVVAAGAVVKACVALQVVPKHPRLHPPELASIEIRPSEAAIESGGVMEYHADGFDRHHRPIGDVTSLTEFTIGPDGSCTENRCTATEPGLHTVTGTARATKWQISDTAKLLVTRRIAGLRIEPGSTTVEVRGSVSYVAYGVDSADHVLVELTDVTTFSMNAPGGCRGRTCTPTTVGAHEVTGTATVGHRVLLDTARLRAIPAVVALELRPDGASTRVGDGVSFTAHGLDAQGRSVVDLTDETEFSIEPSGTCTGTTCEASTPGDHTVTGTVALRGRGLTDTAVLHVTSGITGLALDPSSRTVTAGGTVSYAAWGLDDERRPVVDLTDVTVFTIEQPGSCDGATCTATKAQTYTVTGEATVGSRLLTATATVEVLPGPVDSLALAPARGSATAGQGVTFQARGADAYGNDVGDITARTSFTITDADTGTCTASGTCSGERAQTYTVTGQVASGTREVTGTAVLDVVAGPPTRLVLDPPHALAMPGAGVTYHAYRADDHGNRLDEVTASTELSITGDGSCTERTCSAEGLGSHRVTGTADLGDGTVTATADILVLSVQITQLRLNPYAAHIRPGQVATYVAVGLDSDNNAVSNLTDRTSFSISGDGSCKDGKSACTAHTPGPYKVTGTVPISIRTATGTVSSTVSGEADLTVDRDSVHRVDETGVVVRIELSPKSAKADVGVGVPYRARGYDADGNLVRDVTDSTTFTIAPDGSCDNSGSCVATTPGEHKVTGSFRGVTAVAPAGGAAAGRSGTSGGLTVSRSLGLRTAPRAEADPGISDTASLSATRGPRWCLAMAPADVHGLKADRKPDSDPTAFTLTGDVPLRFVKCPVGILVDTDVVVGSTQIRSDGSIAWTATVSSAPAPRSVSVAVTKADGQVLKSASFQIPPPTYPTWPLWVVVGILVVVAAGVIGTADRDKRQRRWVTQHVNVEPVPADGDISANEDHEDDPATRSHTVHLQPYTDPGSITVTREEEDR